MTPSSEPTGPIIQRVTNAMAGWNQLLAELDREEENFEHVRRRTRDVFFSVLEALKEVETHGDGNDEAAAAARLFNAVVRDLYVFEPAADDAARLSSPKSADQQRQRLGRVELSDLLCDGVARMFDGQARERQAAAVAVEAADEFIPFQTFLKGAVKGQALSPAALAKRLASIDWWYAKWTAQRLKIAVVAKTRDLCLYVWEGDQATLALSTALDGREVRAGQGKEFSMATIKNGSAITKLPQRIDVGAFAIQIRDADGKRWSDLFARTNA